MADPNAYDAGGLLKFPDGKIPCSRLRVALALARCVWPALNQSNADNEAHERIGNTACIYTH
jgi:hypothetical protein